MSDPAIRKRNRANKRKGYRWESDHCKFMNEAGFTFRRNGQRHGGADQGDTDTGNVPLCVQLKDVARVSIWAVADQAAEQASNKGVTDWVVSLRRRGRPTSDGLSIVPNWLYRDMAAVYYREYLDGHPPPASA